MQRITTLLEKIKELNSKQNISIIEVDLMMDYTKVIYADLLEWRGKVVFTEPFTAANEAHSAIPVQASTGVAEKTAVIEEQESVVASMPASPIVPEVTAPSIELDATSMNYEVTPEAPVVAMPLAFTQTHYSGADIRKQIGINDKYQYISELFGNNTGTYEEVINEINTFNTEEEAVNWLNNNVANQLGWKEEHEVVHSFYNLLKEFYTSR